MKTKKALLSLGVLLCSILLSPLSANAQSQNTAQYKDLFNPDTIFNYVWIGLAIAFFVAMIWVLTSAMANLSDALKKRATTQSTV
ncbi:MAG TPA: hypothetical protein VNZ45_13010 [Bacteroidia bacterium]|jgi:hypothetical protein|nr:hypothetical protein [Bacteroidia bacterium]